MAPFILVGLTVAALAVVLVFLFTGAGDNQRHPRVEPTPIVAVAPPPTTPPQEPVTPPPDPIPPTKIPDPPVEDPQEPVDPPRKTDTKDRPPRVQDPLKAIRKAAAACRKKHPGGPAKLHVNYAVLSSGDVKTANAEGDAGALGDCVERAIKATKFAPGGVLLRSIDL